MGSAIKDSSELQQIADSGDKFKLYPQKSHTSYSRPRRCLLFCNGLLVCENPLINHDSQNAFNNDPEFVLNSTVQWRKLATQPYIFDALWLEVWTWITHNYSLPGLIFLSYHVVLVSETQSMYNNTFEHDDTSFWFYHLEVSVCISMSSFRSLFGFLCRQRSTLQTWI